MANLLQKIKKGNDEMKVKHVLIGIGIGFVIGVFFEAVPVFAAIGAVIGVVASRYLQKEREREEKAEMERLEKEHALIKERERQEHQKKQRENRIKTFCDKLETKLQEIEYKVANEVGYTEPSDDYKIIKALKEDAKLYDSEMEYEKAMARHIARLTRSSAHYLADPCGFSGLLHAWSAVSCVACIREDENAMKAAEILSDMAVQAAERVCYLSYGEYGQCILPLEKEDYYKEVEKDADIWMKDILDAEIALNDSLKKQKLDTVNNIVINQLDVGFIIKACILMWYYANKWPFDVTAFDNAKRLYSKFTCYYVSKSENAKEILMVGPVEEVLARIYAKKKVGGAEAVMQEKEYIDAWLRIRLETEDFESCYLLAHGLCWLEMYALEKEVLLRLLEAGADVPVQLQDRLTYLQEVGTDDIKVYDIEPFDNIFFFDSSATEWTSKEITSFFRKIAVKKTKIKYSLAVHKWTKTLPLNSGQQVSKEKLVEDFKSLASDFDGEVNCEVRNSAAINLNNVVYPNAVRFSFTSLRNQCVDILFYCEKFGRNLNITIFTLFTPDDSIAIEELERYYQAIKGNMYVESFRESILQIVDEAIKEKHTVYDEETITPKRKFFEE